MLFERSAISKKPEETVRHDLAQLRQEQKVSPDLLLKDPYVLDFLGLNDHYLEKDLEDAILREIEQFLLELGAGFTFVARQKRLQIDHDDFNIDPLFYNRKLKRLVAIDLKLGTFRHEYKMMTRTTAHRFYDEQNSVQDCHDGSIQPGARARA